MNSTNGALNFDAYIRDTDFNQTIQNMERRLIGLSGSAVKESQKMDSAFDSLARRAAGFFAFTELAQLPGKIVQVRGEFQQLEISFRTMLGSQEKANKLMADVTRFAAVTPYGLKDTAAATKQLLAYGESADTVTETLRKLGDIASGIGAPLGDIAYLYGTTMTQGRLYTQDLNQFTGRGIPMIRELSKIFGVAESEVKALVEAGKVGFPQVQQVIENLTKSGSMFGGLMEAQSKSLPGLIAQLEDAIDVMFNQIGRANEGLATGVITGATDIVENYQAILDVLKVIVAAYGAYKAVLITAAAAQKVAALNLFVTEYMAMGKALGFATANQIAFNRAVLANPYAIAAAAIIGLVTAIAVFRDTTTETEKAQARVANATDKVNESLAGELSKVQLLTSQIKNENVSRDERNKKLSELIALHPKILGGITQENIATEEGTKAINAYIEARKRQIEIEQLNQELTDSIKRQLDAKNQKNETSFLSDLGSSMATMGSGFTAGTRGTDFLKVQATERKKLNADIVKQEADLQKKILERVNTLNSVDAATEKNANLTHQGVKKTVEWYDQEIKALKEKQAKESDSRSAYLAYQKQIDELEKSRTRIVGAKAEKSYESILGKEENRVATKSLEDQLEDKKKMYELYYRWVEHYGVESANKQFDLLLSKNKTFIDYIRSEIAQLEKDKATPGIGIIGPEESYLVKLRSSLNELTGVDTPMQKFAKEMDLARNSSESLTEEILKLKEIQAGLNMNDTSPDGYAKRLQLQERINEATRQRSSQLKEFLVSVVGSEQKRLEIEKHYTNLRVALEKEYANDKGEAYQSALAKINASEQQEFAAFEVEKIKQSKGYKELENVIKLSTNEQTKIRLESERKKLQDLEANNQKFKNANKELTDNYIEQLLKVRQAEEDHKQKSAQMWGQIAGVVGQLGDVIEQMGGGIGEVGSALSGLSSQYGNISQAFQTNSDGSMSMNQYAAAIQGVIQIIGTLVSASKKRAEAERQFAIARLGYEDDYALALNRKIGSNYNQNPFYQDYEGQIKAAVDQYKDALKKYQAAVDKAVEEGRVKERQKDVVDGKTVGQMAGGGAAAGAVIGAAIGVWGFGVLAIVGAAVGAIIGGVVGAIGGLFAKKKKDVYGAIKEQYEDITDEMGNLNVEMAKALIANNQVDEKTKQMLENAIALHEEMQKAREEINSTMKDLTGEIGDNLRNALVNAFKEGKDAAEALRETVGSIIADVASKLIFSKLMGPVIDKLTEEMTYSLTEGDGAIIDDLDRFGNKVNGYALANVKAVEESQKMLDEWLKANGYDTIGGSSKKQNSLSGAIQGMSQETASLIAGQFNAMRISIAESYKIQIDSNQIMRTQLFHLSGIENNTANIDRNTSKLESLLGSMLKKMGGSIDESLRGRGGVGI